MYTACMFCQKPLGSNAVIETFPVGRRLAFDAARGRLWVVCRKCERWNLTPLEERWEAVEDCEQLYRGTRIRASTENVGLARHPEGLELVRIGTPLRDEFAAWRYGDQFGRRMRRRILVAGGGVALGLGLGFSPVMVAMGTIPTLPIIAWSHIRTLAKVRVAGEGASATGPAGSPRETASESEVLRFRVLDFRSLRVLPAEAEPGFSVQVRTGFMRRSFEGENAHRIAVTLLPLFNGWGGSPRAVREAVGEIEAQGDPRRFLTHVTGNNDYHATWRTRPGHVSSMFKPTRLAFEMALHEERERRALEGELWLLERAWQEAEEIAAIADRLLLPGEVQEAVEGIGESRPAEDHQAKEWKR